MKSFFCRNINISLTNKLLLSNITLLSRYFWICPTVQQFPCPAQLVVSNEFFLCFLRRKQGSGHDRGQSPAKWGDFLSVHSSVCQSVNPSVCPSICPSFLPAVHQSIIFASVIHSFISVLISISQFVCLSVGLLVSLSVCLSVCLSVSLSLITTDYQ